ncbi:MAG TPA: MFS transporter [Thermoguttaceae bacterium]|nr:MFS transporter [Thermoguttaceae bacterium]
MLSATDNRLTPRDRRRARRLAYFNGAIWAVGNGLAGTTLVIYLALELGADKIGLGIALILASRNIVGLLRLGAPAMIGRLANRKRFCLATFLISGLLLMTLPWVTAPGRLATPAQSLLALVGLWCFYHLFQYLATIALWSWLADLVPLRIRGRFLGRRQRWMVAGEAAALLCSGLFVYHWRQSYPDQPRWIAYAILAMLGACFMLAALVPLWRMSSAVAATAGKMHRRLNFAAIVAPLGDRRFRRLLLFGCWLAFFNGVSGAAQAIYPMSVLGMGLYVMLSLKTGMRCGQWAVSPWMGKLADRLGNRRVMLPSLALVAAGPFFFLCSTPSQPWWFVGAWVLWIAYAGLNVCLPNLMLKLSPSESNTPHIAMYFTITGLFYALATIAGGAMLDLCRDETFHLFGGAVSLDFFQYNFLFGWITRSLGVLVLLLVIEDDR